MPVPARLVAVVFGLLLAVGCGYPPLPEVDDPCAAFAEPGLYSLPVPGFDRAPTVYVPEGKGPRQALVALHPAGSTGTAMRASVSSLGAVVREEGVVGVFPDGSGTPAGNYWNAGRCCGVASLIDAPDVAYLDAVVEQVRARTCVDRVVATGQSNGGMMLMRWTCEGVGPDAVYASAGPLLTGQCSGDPVPVLESHGAADAVVPPEGGFGSGGDVKFPAPFDAFQAVVERNQCTGEPRDLRDGSLRCFDYDCPVLTRFCWLQGQSHRWPGGSVGGPPDFQAEDAVRALLDGGALPGDEADTDAPGDTGTDMVAP